MSTTAIACGGSLNAGAGSEVKSGTLESNKETPNESSSDRSNFCSSAASPVICSSSKDKGCEEGISSSIVIKELSISSLFRGGGNPAVVDVAFESIGGSLTAVGLPARSVRPTSERRVSRDRGGGRSEGAGRFGISGGGKVGRGGFDRFGGASSI